MSDEEALLAAIRDNPDEDTPRLAYADWLDENATGEAERARAEFIRVQIELETLPKFGEALTEERRDTLTARESELLGRHGAHWLGPLPLQSQSYAPHRVTFLRGFPEAGSFHVDYLRERAEDVLAHPLLRRMGVSSITNDNLFSLLQAPWASVLRGLELSPARGYALAPDWSVLGGCNNLGRLRALALAFGGVLTPDGAERVAANPALSGVETVYLKEDASAESVLRLFDGVAFRMLSRLELSNFHGGLPNLPDLFTNPRLARLEDLRFGGYTADVGGIERLTRGPAWATLRNLELAHGVLEEQAGRSLASARSDHLRSLVLTRNNDFDDRIICGPILWGLRSLDLGGQAGSGPCVVDYLARCPQAVGLWHLGLAGCRAVGDDTVAQLADAPAFSQLRRLDLRNTAMTRDGAKVLAASRHLTNLGSLLVHGCNIGAYAQLLLQARFGAGVRW